MQTVQVKQFCRRHGWKQVEDTSSKDKRRRRWIRLKDVMLSNHIEVRDHEQDSSRPKPDIKQAGVVGTVAANTVSFGAPSEDASQGF